MRAAWWLGLCAAWLAACTSSQQGTTKCQADVACGAFKRCQVDTGQCLCADNRACGRGEFCNASGACQPTVGCLDNTDCEVQGRVPLICDVKRGQCQSADECFDDAHCVLGKVCDRQSNTCTPGCLDEADCTLGTGCLRAQPGDPLGQCQVGTCSTTDQCAAGSNCDLSTHRCVVDQRGPFCGACQRFDPLNPQCGHPANYCLIDTGDPARQTHYCGVDCSQQQGCPSGYDCKPVIIVGPPATPACGMEDCQNGRCTMSGGTCTVPEDCPQGPPGGDCARADVGVCANSNTACASDEDCGGSAGSCLKSQCLVREHAAYGFCSCVRDSDCQPDDCRGADLSDPDHPVLGHCYLSGHDCYASEDCTVIACVNGGCRIGENCKPASERRCVEITQ